VRSIVEGAGLTVAEIATQGLWLRPALKGENDELAECRLLEAIRSLGLLGEGARYPTKHSAARPRTRQAVF
jgi:hypothetical protein